MRRFLPCIRLTVTALVLLGSSPAALRAQDHSYPSPFSVWSRGRPPVRVPVAEVYVNRLNVAPQLPPGGGLEVYYRTNPQAQWMHHSSHIDVQSAQGAVQFLRGQGYEAVAR